MVSAWTGANVSPGACDGSRDRLRNWSGDKCFDGAILYADVIVQNVAEVICEGTVTRIFIERWMKFGTLSGCCWFLLLVLIVEIVS